MFLLSLGKVIKVVGRIIASLTLVIPLIKGLKEIWNNDE